MRELRPRRDVRLADQSLHGGLHSLFDVAVGEGCSVSMEDAASLALGPSEPEARRGLDEAMTFAD